MDELYQYLCIQYAGVLNDQQIGQHIKDYIGMENANWQVNMILQKLSPKGRILDVGSGFGSFVLASRQNGLDAVGIEVAKFEVEFARRRLSREMPHVDPESVYILGDGNKLPFESGSFDVVTLWNVLEHVPDYKKVLAECNRVLLPGGFLYLVCPNYASFRKEAHYHIFWPSLLPKKIAHLYLKLRKKNPAFFEQHIFYRTNWGILCTLKKLNMEVFDVRKEKVSDPILINSPKIWKLICVFRHLHLMWAVHFLLALSFRNPLKGSVFLYACKGDDA